MKTVGEMTVRELEGVVKKVMEEKLYELLGDPDQGLDLRESVKKRLRRTIRDEKKGKPGIPAKEVLTLDGWRLRFDDGWALVRFSGTEPKVRLTAEARDVVRAQEIYDRVLAAVKGAIA